MQYVDGFRDPVAAKVLVRRLGIVAEKLLERRAPVRIMEVCGTHTMAIGRYGIRDVVPRHIELISGPGCPVCVTDSGYIDAAVELARRGVLIVTFGDMLRVPGSREDLASVRAEGAAVRICYSPLEAVDIAVENPSLQVVFLAIGFETTVAPVLSIIEVARKRQVENISLLTSFMTIPKALEVLAGDSAAAVSAFLAPAHVSAIIGASAYEPLVRRFRLPCVIAGFEPLDILYGIERILEQLFQGDASVENLYARVVKGDGNRRAQALIGKYLEPADVAWRGLGTIPASGLALRSEYSAFDAAVRHAIDIVPGVSPAGCRCGEVLKGAIRPSQCVLFGRACTPASPVGPCMVSAEGTCAAYYKYSGGAAR